MNRLCVIPSRVALTILAATTSLFAQARVAGPDLSPTGKLAKRTVDSINIGLTGQSSPCLNQPDCETQVGPASTQAETTIAVDSTGQHVVIGFNDFRGFSNANVSISGFMYSDDGGVTFADGGQLPTGPTTVISGQRFPQVFGDPDVKYLGGCNFVYSSILLKVFSATTVVETMSVHRSTDCGHSWSGPFEVVPATNPNGKVDVNGAPQDAADKELGDVDPDTGRYMMCWSNFTPAAVAGVEISCAFSDDILTATPPTFSTRRVVAATAADGQNTSVRFAGNGSPNVYLAWSRFPGTLSGYANNVGFARSTDNGATWSAPVNLTSDFITMDYVLGNDRVNNSPTLAVDNSAGPSRGNIYVVYANNNSLDGADVSFQRSLDGGLTFSAPINLNARPGSDRAQWFPYVTVDSSSGRVWVFYYDQGVATSGDLTEVTYLYSDNAGATWSMPVPLTSRPFKAGWGNDTGAPNLGDYNQAVAQSGSFFAAYASTVLVGFADGQPSTSMTTPDVSITKVASTTVKPPLHAGALTFTESGGDGNIDPGEQVNLKIQLTNYDTNPLHAGSVSGIFATLSTLTPGVSVTQPGSAYPSLAPGASAANNTDFILQLSPGFVPGTPIEFSLAVSSSLGSTTLLLTQSTGTPVYTTLLNESFDGVAPGALPAGWSAAHGAGVNTVPWVTSNSFAPSLCGTSNKAFHANANDAPTGADRARWERLFSPIVTIPPEAQYVTLDFDVCYDTENDPVLPGLGYDGFFLRITDQTPGRTLRSVLAEAFAEDFTTDGFQHYPKHLPRNGDANYFEDMSAWSGFSNGPQHVHLKFGGMAGSRAQLRFEFTQDQVAICSDVRPGHACGVTVDNVVMRSVVSIQPLSVTLSVSPSLSRDPLTNEIVATITATNTGTGTASNVQLTSVLLGSAAPSTALPNLGNISAGGSAAGVVRFPASAGPSGVPSVLRVAGSYNGGSFTSTTRVTLP